MKKYLSKELALSFLAIFLFSIPVLLPLLHKGFFLSDDGEWMIVRLSAFFEALRNGQFPPRFLIRLDNQFGYPLSNFAYPGFLYLGSIIHIFKFNFMDSIKILIFLSLFLSSVFTYLFLRRKFDNISALLGSFINLYTPYHLFDLYRRGSVGELLAISIIPFLFLQADRKNKYLLSLGVFGLILSHNIIALISLPFVFLYSVLVYRKDLKKKWIELVTPYVLGVAMASFFFIPAVYDLRYIIFTTLKISDWHLYFASFSILGISTITLILVSVLFYLKKRNTEFLFFILLSAFSAFMGTAISTKVWEVIPSSFILFPYRFLSILPIGMAFIAAYIVFNLKKPYKILALVILPILFFYYSFSFTHPIKQYGIGPYLSRDDAYYASNFASTTAVNEYTPKWVKEMPLENPKERVEIVSGDAQILTQNFNSKKITLTIKGNTPSQVMVNIFYFPGWQAFIDSSPTTINYQNKHGGMMINVPQGSHNIVLEYNEIGIHLYSDLLSIAAFSILVLMFVKEKKSVFKKN